MTEREHILGHIREALKTQAQDVAAFVRMPQISGTLTSAATQESRDCLPPAGANFEERLARFRTLSVDLKTEFVLLENAAQARDTLRKLREREGWQRVASHAGALTQPACEGLGVPVLWTDNGYAVNELETCDAGVTECDALVAQTGSALVTSRSAGGRALSVLPPHHVVLARREQLVGDLTDALALVNRKYAPNYPSMISLITGPSRTGDIERILVLGAHGPKKLTIFCV